MNENIHILVVDDEPNSTKLMSKILSLNGYKIREENNSITAKELIESENFDLIISDLQMPGLSGLDLLKAKQEKTLFIMVTGYGSVDSAVESMKVGAYDYISKPFNMDEFSLKIKKAVEKINLSNQITRLKSQIEEEYSFSNIIGKSRKMQSVFELIKNVSKTNINILIEGQSGTGKELFSKAIHNNSNRSSGPFIAINCSAIPENLLESELFGHTKGAFTGATEFQKGVFEQANGGTLLLDEIADMPFNLQSKLLRVIENWEIKPLGSDKVKKIDVRLISATNQNLKEMILQKKFRDDLYYRISNVTITLPPLNERRDDIPLIANHILKKLTKNLERNLTINSFGMEILMKHDWKGNVRQLENAIERAAITSSENELGKSQFKFLINTEITDVFAHNSETGGLKDIEKNYIQKILEENKWNKLKVSKLLGIDRKTLYKKIREYNLE